MKLRTQLLLLFLLLAGLPLVGIVVYSYVSTVRAYTAAAEEENRRLAAEMTGRMEEAQADLGRRFARFEQMAETIEQPPELARLLPQLFGEVGQVIEVLQLDSSGQPVAAPVDPATLVEGAPPAAVAPTSPVTEPRNLAELVERLTEAGLRAGLSETKLVETLRSAQDTMEFREIDSEELAVRYLDLESLREGFSAPFASGSDPLGELRIRVLPTKLIEKVLASLRRDQEEVPFAVGDAGELIFASDEDRARLEGLPLAEMLSMSPSPAAESALRDWVVVAGPAEPGTPRFAIARPLAQPLAELRKTAARNLALGLGLVSVCILGMLPMSRRLTRSLDELAVGAERVAAGELATQVPVRSGNELGRLARAFNRMAGDLEQNQRLLLEGEEKRREQALAGRLLQAENERKSRELEQARRFQLSLLPRTLPKRDDLEIAVAMRTATEVGGDYYDFHQADDGTITLAVGDATGHGAAAGTMVTVLKGLFTAQAAGLGLTRFLSAAGETIRSMELGRLMMALALARISGRSLTVASAGMPPVLVYRAARGQVEEIALAGVPLGGPARFEYQQHRTDLEPGDVVLFMSDGFPELPNENDELLGYRRAEAALRACANGTPQQVIAHLLDVAKEWNGGAPLPDDATFVVLRAR